MPNAKATRKSEKSRAAELFAALSAHYPQADCALTFANPLQLLIATILSAQSTDKMVNQVSPSLFARFRTASDFAAADSAELEALIRPTGFFRNKARHIQEACRILSAKHQGQVPPSMIALLELPGVARKTANVVLGVGFGIAEGVVVDTHVQRLSRRLGLTRESRPEKIESDLMKLFPRTQWIRLSHLLIHHGRTLCIARGPKCSMCPVESVCDSPEKTAAKRRKGGVD